MIKAICACPTFHCLIYFRLECSFRGVSISLEANGSWFSWLNEISSWQIGSSGFISYQSD